MFGQEDHVRCYGPDYEERLSESGFEVRVMSVEDLIPVSEREKLGLLNEATGDIHFLRQACE